MDKEESNLSFEIYIPKDIVQTNTFLDDNIPWSVIETPVDYDSEDTREIVENLDWSGGVKIHITGLERILKT